MAYKRPLTNIPIKTIISPDGSIADSCLRVMNIEGNTTSEIGNKLPVKRVAGTSKLATLVRKGTTEIDNGRRRRAMRTTTPGINAAFTCLSGTLQLSCIAWTVSNAAV